MGYGTDIVVVPVLVVAASVSVSYVGVETSEDVSDGGINVALELPVGL